MSFNFDLYNEGNTYFNNMDYTICFRKEPGFCTMTYSVPTERDPDDDQDPTKPTRPGASFRYFDIDPESKVAEGPGVGVLKCPSDYLLLGGIRFCGGRINSHIFSPNPQGDTEVTGNYLQLLLRDFLTLFCDIRQQHWSHNCSIRNRFHGSEERILFKLPHEPMFYRRLNVLS